MKTAKRISYRDVLELLRQGKGFHGFMAVYKTPIYELSEKGHRIDADDKYEFMRQMYAAQDAIVIDNRFTPSQQIRYFLIVEET